MAQAASTKSKSIPAKKPAAKATAAKSPASKPASVRTAKRTATPKAPPKPPVRKPPAPEGQKAPAKQTRTEHAAHVDRVWQLAKRMTICMFATWDGNRIRSRPLAATVEKDEHAIWFLTDVEGQKDNQIEKFPKVTLTFSDNGKNKYVAITGTAELLVDKALIKKLWTPFSKAWWDGPDDPKIRVIKVTPEDAELWDAPGGILAEVAMLAKVVTGQSRIKIGENAKVSL
jgi:general stress protein 26